MSKGSAYDFLGLYRMILADVSDYFPNDRTEWERDLVTLTRNFEKRGQAIFTIDLPAIGKALDRALDDRRLIRLAKPLSGPRHPGTVIPRLFWGLWVRLFEVTGCLKQDIDPNVVLFLRTLLYVGKNLKGDCSPRYLYEATKEFFDIEGVVPPPSQFWDGGFDDDHDCDPGHLRDFGYTRDQDGLLQLEPDRLLPMLESTQLVADRLVSSLGWFDPAKLDFRHGPGAVSDLSKREYKYVFPNWSPRLDRIFPFESHGSTLWGLLERLQLDGIELDSFEPCSKLIAVPKTQKGPRLIASEPVCNQWIQQGIRDFLYNRVERSPFGVALNFRAQEPSQTMTLLGSIDGSISTIDLKSASDRLSCLVVQRIFRRNQSLLRAMAASRTRFLRNTLDKKNPELVKLRKFSTQGSALTFPVQSIVFLACALGVGRHLEPNARFDRLIGMVRVFGDDIIVPKLWEPHLSSLLERLGLKVNRTKTFSEGNFRESCGMDAWSGYDVTPPHVTMSIDESQAQSVISNVAVSNNFFMKGFWRTANWLKETVNDRLIPVIGIRSGIFGFKSFCGAPIPSITKWSKNTHQDIALVRTAIARNKVVKQETAASLLQYFTERPDPWVNYESGVTVAGTPVLKRAWVPLEMFG